jgi:hypothetical protein
MGTRSLTRVFETYTSRKTNKVVKEKLMTMYRQYDGYPSGMGMDLANFLESGKVVNGIGADSGRVFNGSGCLSAQLIAELKDGPGNLYIYPINAKDCGEEYEYHIIVDFDTKEVTFKCFTIGYIDKKGNYNNNRKELYSGSPKGFITLVEENIL